MAGDGPLDSVLGSAPRSECRHCIRREDTGVCGHRVDRQPRNRHVAIMNGPLGDADLEADLGFGPRWIVTGVGDAESQRDRSPEAFIDLVRGKNPERPKCVLGPADISEREQIDDQGEISAQPTTGLVQVHIDAGHLAEFDSYQELNDFVGGTAEEPAILSKFGLIIKERNGIQKARMILDTKATGWGAFLGNFKG